MKIWKNKKYKVIVVGVVVLLLLVILYQFIKPATYPVLFTEEQQENFVNEVNEIGVDPTYFVLNKFNNHDYVFLGETHRVKQDISFVVDLIPELHKNGINILVLELLEFKDQDKVDQLLLGAKYDNDLARMLFAQCNDRWPYQEYLDILKTAWQQNQSLEDGQKAFRIIAMNPTYNIEKINYGTDEEKTEERQLISQGDQFMANVIIEELIPTNEKALIYSGIHHAFTHFYWNPDFKRAGNYVYDLVGDRACTISFYYPFVDTAEKNAIVPFDGLIELTYDKIGEPYALDLANSSLGSFQIQNTHYNEAYINRDGQTNHFINHPELQAKEMYHGLIVLSPLTEFEGPTIIKDWLDTPDMQELIQRRWYQDREWDEDMYFQSAKDESNWKQLFQRWMIDEWKGLFE
ncbi:MAG: ChaN family lipoprotein [Eubacteriales bacterium]